MHDAVVIGAGISGLVSRPPARGRRGGCRRLEAAARVGGRVWSPTGPGGRWEAGGEAVDLANDRLRALAEEVGAGLRRSEVGLGRPRPGAGRVARRRPHRHTRRAGVSAPARRGRPPRREPRGRRPLHGGRVDGPGRLRDVRPRRGRDRRLGDVRDDAGQAHVAPRARGQDGRPKRRRRRRGAAVHRRRGRVRRDAGGGLGDRVRLRSAASAIRERSGAVEVEIGSARLRARRAIVAVPLHARRRIAGLPPVSEGSYGVAAKSLIELAGDLPDAPTAVLTDTALGYAYRRDPRSLGSFVGSTPAAWLLAAGKRRADAAVAEAVRRCFRGGRRPDQAGGLSAELPDLRAGRAPRLGRAPGRAGRPGPLRRRGGVRAPELHGGRGQGGGAGRGRGPRRRLITRSPSAASSRRASGPRSTAPVRFRRTAPRAGAPRRRGGRGSAA